MSRSGWIVHAVYATALSAAFALILADRADSRATKAAFDEIEVHRIDVVEPDGTLRMVISNHADLPGVIVNGEERPLDRPQAGMLFYNDDGSETGGLIFGGHRNEAGKIENSGGSLSFDRYGANQIVQLLGVDDATDKLAGLVVSDSDPQAGGNRRIWVGRGDDGAARIELRDADGHERIVLEVMADGASRLAFLDADGRVRRELVPGDR